MGAPYGRCTFKGACSAATGGIDGEIVGIINEDEDGGAKNEEGLTRLVVARLLLLLLFKSGPPCSEIGAVEAETDRTGTCGVGAVEVTTVGP